ncbi:Six-hairpin glycosidase [Punctularia strigosozonata HHB-11173 SS5]|uniref:Six-hairpin glycosidase n=1 Tax=Punctularia strigosozonata (strain HHB-11173) TaxID=741275 RepID=UPI0004418360|nr:Six-hairpin glycosidase [Punctularia strigosozonata HHB-11173 SS5]EIN05763.1 Six-hairpin glycosidase [Punctularia strigosozonata HHB-11173 SS5]
MTSWLRTAIALSAICAPALSLAPSGAWDKFNYAPDSKTVYPTAVHSSHGAVKNAKSLLKTGRSGSLTTLGNGSWIALDFGIEVGGLISLNLHGVSSPVSFALSFTESPTFIRPDASDDSTYPDASTTYDGIEPVTVSESGLWTQPARWLRGGFRYLTIASNATELTVSNVSCAISFMPHVDDLRAYAGYFSTEDTFAATTAPGKKKVDGDFLTKLWYAGAYTVQTNTVPVNTGRQIPVVASPGWANNATLGVAGPIIVDGAKRDRAVWPGDMGIAVPTQFVSTNDLLPTKNALSTMFVHINPVTGALPESGPPLSQLDSDTYHMWTLIGTYNYHLYSGDDAWLSTIWANYTKAVAYVESKVDSSGLMNVTGLRDWARLGGGGHNAEGNAILYKVLTNSAELASSVPVLNASELGEKWAANATALKAAFNGAFWDEGQGMYVDNTTTTLAPQDANSFAVLFNVTDEEEKKALVSAGLERNWNELGPVAPELPDTISPFIGGFELQAHFEAGNDARAMDLLHRTWGYMLYTNLSVQSTLLEGFTANGSLSYRSYRGYNYDPAYTSHAHGWSSGPTSALTFYVLGLTVTKPQGTAWAVAPHLSGLKTAQGEYETPLGWFGVKWTWSRKTFELKIETPKGTAGEVTLPKEVKGGKVSVDGGKARKVGGSLEVGGGKHAIVVRV